MPSKPFFSPTSKTKPPEDWGGCIDVAARYFVYELYDASGYAGAWKVLREKGQVQATVARAVERGWAIVREDGKGKSKVRSASLTMGGAWPSRASGKPLRYRLGV
jgi:hypothetical protein